MNRLYGVVGLLALLFSRPANASPAAKVATGATAVAAGAVAAWLVIAGPLVASFEGYSGKPYRDSVGVKTICYGATAADHVDFSKIYTKTECLRMLDTDLEKYKEQIRPCIPKIDTFPPHRIAALVSFAYNLGPHALCGPVGRYLNTGNVGAGCNALLAYNHAGGRVLAGLTRRRMAERSLCLRAD